MRKLLIALAIMLVSMPAYAQMGGGGKHRAGGSRNTTTSDADKQKRMAKEEAAAKAAMKTVPDSKEKYDPWKIGK